LTLLILIVVGAVSFTSTTKFTDASSWVQHTHEVLDNASDLRRAVADAVAEQRGYVITGQERFLDPFRVASASINESLQNLRNLTSDNPVQQQRLDTLEPLVRQRLVEFQSSMDARADKGFAPAAEYVLSDHGRREMEQISQLTVDIEREERDLLKRRSLEEQSRAKTTNSTILFGSVIAVLFVAIAGALLTRDIASPLKELSRAAERIAEGDLLVELPAVNREDEVGMLSQTFLRMTHSLRQIANFAKSIARGDLTVDPTPQSEKDVLGNAFAGMVTDLRKAMREISGAIDVLGSSASEILATTRQVSTGAAETATSVTETTTTIEEVKQTALVSCQKAKRVSENAQNVAKIAQGGKKSVEGTIEEMTRMRTQMELIAESIVRLSEQSQAIGEIVATVNDLADQSNLLAVNAAIEAAKAGDQGRGFAVVAQEVRSLAEQSKKATVQVRTILSDIQKATHGAVMATEQGGKSVESGVLQATQSGDSVRTLADSVMEASQAATQIAASSQQQLLGMDQVATAMESIKDATAQNIAGARQSEAAAKNLQELGHKLKDLVGRYKLATLENQGRSARAVSAGN
jgi:methyl-accepting chemotaxis protein